MGKDERSWILSVKVKASSVIVNTEEAFFIQAIVNQKQPIEIDVQYLVRRKRCTPPTSWPRKRNRNRTAFTNHQNHRCSGGEFPKTRKKTATLLDGTCKNTGIRIVPVNPGADQILGEPAYPDLKGIPFPVDVVDIFRRPEDIPATVEAGPWKSGLPVILAATWNRDGARRAEGAS